MFELLIATKNTGKIKEIEKLLVDLPVKIRSLQEFKNVIEPEETGLTFTENAILKAVYYAKETGITALADDSGLEVEALDGRPGIFSARYAGEKATDEEKNSKLLSELRHISKENRQARFVCVMAVADKDGTVKRTEEGICEGRIAHFSFGKNGFGYDPIFIPEGFSDTFGVISSEIKQKISHRARATAKMVGFLRNFVVV